MAYLVGAVWFCLAWLVATLVGGLLGNILGSPLRAFGGMGYGAGFAGVSIAVAAFSWLGRDPLWLCVAVGVGNVLNELVRLPEADPNRPQVQLVGFYNLVGSITGSISAWIVLR